MQTTQTTQTNEKNIYQIILAHPASVCHNHLNYIRSCNSERYLCDIIINCRDCINSQRANLNQATLSALKYRRSQLKAF